MIIHAEQTTSQRNSPIRKSAYKKLRNAVRLGVVIRPSKCESCGKDPGLGRDGRSLIQGHHLNGYKDPFDVNWLCVFCHAKVTPQPSGAENNMTKISDTLVSEIRASNESTKAIARRLGVSHTQIRHIRNWEWRRSVLISGWRSINDAPTTGTRFLGVVDGEVRFVAWGKTSHIPIYGWLLVDQGPESADLCQPSCWMPLPDIPTTERAER